MADLPNEVSEMSSAGYDLLEYFADLQSVAEGDTITGENHSQNSV